MAVVVPIISSFDSRGITKAVRDFSKLEKSSDKLAFGLRATDQAATKMAIGFAKIAAAGAVVAGVVGKQLIDAASSLAESQSKVNVVFGDSAKAVTDFANTAATKMGMSKQAALEAAGTFGNLIQAFGLGQAQAQDMSTTLVQLASDLASFNNTSTEDAIQALRSGLSGETEPLKKYGVALNDVRLKQVAMNMGLYDGKGALDITAKTQAAYALILQDTALAQGDYARTADGVANRQRTLQAAFQDVKAEIGTALIPVYQSLLGFLQEKVLPVFSEFGRILGSEGVGAAFRYLGGQILGAITNLNGFGTATYALVAALVILKAATIAQTVTLGVLNVANALAKAGFLGTTVGVYALNAAMKANQISLVVAAVVALITAIGFLLVKFGLLQKAFGAIKAIGGAVIGFFQRNKELHLQNARAAETHSAALRNLENRYQSVSRSVASTNEKSYKFFRDSETGALAMRVAIQKGTDAFTDGVGGAGKTVETAAEKLKKYTDAFRGLTSAQRAARDAQANLTKAQDDYNTLTDKVAKAQKNLQQIVEGYGRDSKQAKDRQAQLDKAQRAVERSGYDVEAAIFAVKDAEKDLAELRKDPTTSAQAIREAEIKLAEAKLRVADANDAQVEAVKNLDEAQRLLNEAVNGATQDSETYKDALKEVEDLLLQQKDAQDKVTKAIEDQRDATYELIEAENKLNEIRKNTPAAIITRAETLLGGDSTDGEDAGGGVAVISGGGQAIPASLFGGGSAIRDAMLDAIPFASGGIVTSPTLGLIGEAGAEAVIPLDQAGSLGGTQNIYLTVNAGMGVDPAVVGDEIVNVLQRYNRRNGALPLKVA